MQKLVFSYLFIVLSVHITLGQKQEPRLVLPVGHTGSINSAVFSPDDKLVITQSRDGSVKIWDAENGKELKDIFHENYQCIGINNTGSLAFFASKNKPVIIHELIKDSIKILPNKYNQNYSRVFFNKDNTLVTAFNDGPENDSLVCVWNLVTNELVGNFLVDNCLAIDISKNNKLLLTITYSKKIQVWDLVNNNILLELDSITYNYIRFSSDSKSLLIDTGQNKLKIIEINGRREINFNDNYKVNFASSLSENDNGLIFYDYNPLSILKTETGEVINLKRYFGYVYSHCFSHDNKYLTTTSKDSITRLWEVQTGNLLKSFKGGSKRIYSVSFSNDDKKLLTAEDNGDTRIWDVDTGKELVVLKGYSKSVRSKLCPKNKFVVNYSKNKAWIWNIETGENNHLLERHTGLIYDVQFSANNKLIVTSSSDSTCRIWELSTGKLLYTLPGHKDAVISSVFSSNDQYLTTILQDNSAWIWDINKKQIIRKIKHTDDGRKVKLFDRDNENGVEHNYYSHFLVTNSDGTKILTSYGDSSFAKVWDAQTGEVLFMLNENSFFLRDARFSIDNKYIATMTDSNTYIWNAKTGELIHHLNYHKDNVEYSFFSADGKYLATSSWDSTIVIWELETGKKITRLKMPSKEPETVVFNTDGSRILTVPDISINNIIKYWDTESGTLIHTLDNSSWPSAEFTLDSKFILTTGSNHKTILWDVETGKPLYTRLQLENNDWLVYDEDYRFDGTPGAIDYLYLTCGLEVIDLAQVKDSLWVPGLVEKIMNGVSIMINDRPAPKLKDLNICELTPVIEPIENGDKGLYRYKIIPRNGGLGETEVYINGNLTYKFKPDQLQKKLEEKKEVYYLSFSSDTLQGFLTGEKNSTNPILVKAKVKGSGIYGRGVILDLVKNTEKESPKFYGLFIGVNDYGNSNKESSEQRYRDLNFAKKDADDLSNAVEATARNLFKEDCHIYRLTGTGNSENAPTKANIQKALKEIGEKAKASDILYIFFAGHGDIPEKSGEKEIRFILHKAYKKNLMSSSFGVDELTDWCHPKNIKAQKRVFVFDACHSGQIINQTMAFNGRGDDESTRIRQLDKLKDKNGMMILAAAADNESAYEDETLNQGVLTYHLLQVMKEQQKDTSLVIRSWFDETIDLVKDYSRVNGNKQEPNSFGDGRFEIGNITNEVRQKIDISCPKTRIGMCDITMNLDAKAIYPQLRQKVNNYFTSPSARGDFVFSKNLDKSYRVVAACNVSKKKVEMYYDIFLADQQIGNTIILPKVKNKTEEELVKLLTDSITVEIERIDERKERCKLKE